MSMKNGRSSILLLLIILIFIALIVYVLYINGVFNKQEPINYEKNDLFFVTKTTNGYGINKSDGTTILESSYKKILRNKNSVYINDGVDSYVFFLDSNKSISLGGKETDVFLAYDKNDGTPLPYFILVYGSGSSAIYRIYTDQGIRHSSKDFTSLNSAYVFLDAKVKYKTTSAPKSLTEKYSTKGTLSYPTEQMRTQYIVSNKNDNTLVGVVDESGRIVLDIACASIKEMTGTTNGIVVQRNEKTYLFFANEKLLEVDNDFEFVTGNEYVYQKKGNTVNKVYNLNGEVVIDGIYDYNKEFFPFPTLNASTYMFVKEKDDNNNNKENGNYLLYNISTNKMYDTKYTNLSAEYLKEYADFESMVWTTGFIYISDNIPYCVDFNTMKSSRINVVKQIYSPLDIGYKYEFVK